MKAKFVYESLDFERGKEPKKSLNIGRESLKRYEFESTTDAADWAIKNLNLITDNKYLPNEPIRTKDYDLIPKELSKYIEEWAMEVVIDGPLEKQAGLITFANILRAFGEMLKFKGLILRESLDFERGRDPKDSMRIGAKYKWNMSAKDLAVKIMEDINDDDHFRDAIIRSDMAAEKGGYKDVAEYWDVIYGEDGTNPNPDYELEEVEKWLSEVDEILNDKLEKYPWKPGKKGIVSSTFYDGAFNGVAYGSALNVIENALDSQYFLSEALDFERGQDPKKSIGIGLDAMWKKLKEKSRWKYPEIEDVIKSGLSLDAIKNVDPEYYEDTILKFPFFAAIFNTKLLPEEKLGELDNEIISKLKDKKFLSDIRKMTIDTGRYLEERKIYSINDLGKYLPRTAEFIKKNPEYFIFLREPGKFNQSLLKYFDPFDYDPTILFKIFDWYSGNLTELFKVPGYMEYFLKNTDTSFKAAAMDSFPLFPEAGIDISPYVKDLANSSFIPKHDPDYSSTSLEQFLGLPGRDKDLANIDLAKIVRRGLDNADNIKTEYLKKYKKLISRYFSTEIISKFFLDLFPEGLPGKKLKDRSEKEKEVDYKKAENLIKSSGFATPRSSATLRKLGSLSFEIPDGSYYTINKSGYLRKQTPTGDRAAVIMFDPFSSYEELTKEGLKRAEKAVNKFNKAKFVYESLDFERGKDSKRGLGIGMEERIRTEMENDYLNFKWDGRYELALKWAAEKGKIDIIQWLLKAGTDPSYNESKALKAAALNNQAEAVEILVDAGADPMAGNGYPILVAKSRGHTELSDRLKELAGRDNEGNPGQPSLKEYIDFERGQDPKKAIGVGIEERIRQGINRDWYPNRKNEDSWHGDLNVALVWAAETGQIDILKWILDAGADPTYDDSKAFKQAATFGQDEAVEILVDAGADPLAGNGYAMLASRFAGYHELSDRIKELAARDEQGRPWQPQTVRENLDFERGQDPKRALGIGSVKIKGDRGSGEYNVVLLEPYKGLDLLPGEIVWKARDTKDGKIVYVVKYSDFKSKRNEFWGEIDPFISDE